MKCSICGNKTAITLNLPLHFEMDKLKTELQDNRGDQICIACVFLEAVEILTENK